MNKNFVKIKKILIIFILLVILICILFKSKQVINSVLEAINIFMNNLFPCIFIFYTITDLLINYDILNILNINSNSIFIIFFSIISGFPSGSKYITDFYKNKLITKEESNYLLTFTHFSNPLFLLGIIREYIGLKITLLILISHYLSNILIAIILHKKSSNYKRKFINHQDLITCLNNSFTNTFKIIIIILSYSIIFITLSNILNSYIKSKTVNLIIYSFLDITKASIYVLNSNFLIFFKGLLILVIISFGGINVHMQVRSIIKKESISYSYFLTGRIISTFLSIIIYIVIFNIF